MATPSTTSLLVRIDNKTVRGPGLIVRIPDIHHAIYDEAGSTASVEIEGGLDPDGEVNWLVYDKTLVGWDPPNARLEMPVSKRSEILEVISRSLDLLGMPHQIV
jgi:hypothetical protein